MLFLGDCRMCLLRLALLAAALCTRCYCAAPDAELCSHVNQMQWYCSNRSGIAYTEVRGPVGKAGPRGPSGPPGSPAKVDYDAINENITERFEEMKKTNDKKIATCEAKIEAVKKANDEKMATFEAKFETLENRYRPLLMTGCEKVSRADANEWDGTGGIFDIYRDGTSSKFYCDITTDGGGWLVFQRRKDGSVNFYRNWNDYVKGFGKQTGEFWLGLETLQQLTQNSHYELRVDLKDWSGNRRYAKYSTFRVGDAASSYRLTASGYSGNAGESLLVRSNGMKFSTKDRDSDTWSTNCAASFKGAWWYAACHHSNLNGQYFNGGSHKSFADGIEWYSWKGYYYSMKFTEMKIRKL